MIKRYDCTDETGWLYDADSYDDGRFCFYSDIDPILKAARVLAESWIASSIDPNNEGKFCECANCQAARLIIEITEGLE